MSFAAHTPKAKSTPSSDNKPSQRKDRQGKKPHQNRVGGKKVRAEKSPPNARLAAIRVYLAFTRDLNATNAKTALNAELHTEPPQELSKDADKRLYVQLLKGMVRHKRFLEDEVARLATKPFDSLDDTLVALVVMGLFQLRFLSLAPHAAVHETVALATLMHREYGKGWVNALLRSSQREGLKELESPRTMTLAQETSHPDWLVSRWIDRFGEARTQELCRANNHFKGAAIRVETGRITPQDLRIKLTDEGVRAEPHPLLPSALWVENLGAVLASQAFAQGLCTVQDTGSQLLMAWAAPLLQGRVLDACAAPGGKFTALASTGGPKKRDQHGVGLHEEGLQKTGLHGTSPRWIVAADSDNRRMQRVRENLKRLRLGKPPLLVADAAHQPFGPVWDAVLLDVPCSATGMIRKYPELKWRKHLNSLPPLVQNQQTLLAESARITRPGGVVLYATCSLEHEENAGVVDAFLGAHPQWTRIPFSTLPVPSDHDDGVEIATQALTAQGDLLLLPGDTWMSIYGALLHHG